MVGGWREVGQQAGAEADEGAADMAIDQGEAEHGEEHQVRYGAREMESGEDTHLDHQGDDHQGGGEQHPVEAHEGFSSYCPTSYCSCGCPSVPSPGSPAPGVTVTVTVGVGVAFGLSGRTVSRGSLRGAWTTTPTMSSWVKDTNGLT